MIRVLFNDLRVGVVIFREYHNYLTKYPVGSLSLWEEENGEAGGSGLGRKKKMR
jgi:hypothetical protein